MRYMFAVFVAAACAPPTASAQRKPVFGELGIGFGQTLFSSDIKTPDVQRIEHLEAADVGATLGTATRLEQEADGRTIAEVPVLPGAEAPNERI